MQIVECKCTDCRTEFKVKRIRGLPPWDLTCPICESKHINLIKIDGDED